MNKNQKIVVVIVAITVVGLIIYLLVKTKNQEKKINALEYDQLRLQKFLIEKYGESQEVIENEINRLIDVYSQYPETVKSLSRAKELYNEGHIEEAIRKLVVVIENKLKLKLESEGDSWFIALSDRKRKFARFDELLKRARELNLFNELQLSIVQSSIQIRHGESHHEGFEDNGTKSQICMLGSIEVIGLLAPVKEVKLINC